MVEVVALAGPLADAREHRESAMSLGDVVDQLEDHDGLPHPGAAEGPRLAALDERADEVDHLDARLEDLGLGVLVHEQGRRPVDRVSLLEFHRPRPSTVSPVTLKIRPRTPSPTGTVIGPPVS